MSEFLGLNSGEVKGSRGSEKRALASALVLMSVSSLEIGYSQALENCGDPVRRFSWNTASTGTSFSCGHMRTPGKTPTPLPSLWKPEQLSLLLWDWAGQIRRSRLTDGETA